ncbi:hypothetical protein [Streptomyces sp. NPDC021212]|uniref:hypothetical protein n=1 Tax=Streptomyces sp. NPDC021212 TaxID=3365118 RepID=UPI0037929723
MEIAELVLKYIETLVWPAVTVGLVWGLRGHIREAFTRMTRLETPAGAIEFETQAREVLSLAEEVVIADAPVPFAQGVPTPRPQPWPPYPAPAGEPAPERAEEDLAPPAGEEAPPPQAPQGPAPQPAGAWSPPSYAQPAPTEAPYWREQLSEARTMADASPVGAVVTAWNALLSMMHDGLPPDMVDVVNRLRTLRNQAVHQAHTVTPTAARSFIESCHHVALLVGTTRRP